ncbi:MAG TPA: hypothetical protein VF288_10925 [Mycobacteriales bacterium]
MHRPRPVLLVAVSAVLVGLAGTGTALASTGRSATAPTVSLAALAAARAAEPVVLEGSQIPGWAEPAATGVAAPFPSGTSQEPGEPALPGVGLRSAHNGTIVVPPDLPGVAKIDPNTVAAYHWTRSGWAQIPVQVDQRFPYFLANGRSSFGIYSGTDEELTYAWTSDSHDAGQESWKRLFGTCDARFADSLAEVQAGIASGLVTPGAGETAADYLTSMQDPQPLFDTDDQLSFMAGDAGPAAPHGTAPPKGTANGQVVQVADPVNPGHDTYVYLFTQPGGSSFNASNGYVHMSPNADASQWIDRYSFAHGSPNAIGISNTGYGPNLPETVCDTAAGNDGGYPAGTAPRASKDANPRDDFTITTPTYEIDTTGRWLVTGLHVTKPGTSGQYGPNIISRWKGRAFQQSPDSDISLVGFEDEQTNWEMNSSLLGWRAGPVRAIREVWGADSGTNVTKTETYYRDADVFAYHLRVHPIPPDGLYTDWDYQPGVATTYYNLKKSGGVAIDGKPDSDVGEVDTIPVTGTKAEVNVCDPTYEICSALDNPEEVAGPGFGLVYDFELTSPSAVTGANVAIIPYYRDDACFDDGTGDAPAPRPWPGEKSTSTQVQAGYVAYWQRYWDTHPAVQKFPRPTAYSDLVCDPGKAVHGDPTANPNVPPWKIMPFQGAIGENGIHFLITQDSDNDFSPAHTDEVDGQQWRFEVPMATPTNVLVPYGLDVSAKLLAVATPYVAALQAG